MSTTTTRAAPSTCTRRSACPVWIGVADAPYLRDGTAPIPPGQQRGRQAARPLRRLPSRRARPRAARGRRARPRLRRARHARPQPRPRVVLARARPHADLRRRLLRHEHPHDGRRPAAAARRSSPTTSRRTRRASAGSPSSTRPSRASGTGRRCAIPAAIRAFVAGGCPGRLRASRTARGPARARRGRPRGRPRRTRSRATRRASRACGLICCATSTPRHSAIAGSRRIRSR